MGPGKKPSKVSKNRGGARAHNSAEVTSVTLAAGPWPNRTGSHNLATMQGKMNKKTSKNNNITGPWLDMCERNTIFATNIAVPG